jgi:hypothetical protein
VNYSEAPMKIPEGAKFGLESLVHRTLSGGAPDIVWWHTGQSGVLDQGYLRLPLALLVEPILWSFIG